MHLANIAPVEPPPLQPTVPFAESLRSFIAGYRGTPCLSAEVSVVDNNADVTTFGSAEASRQFASALRAAFPRAVSARATVISPNQCAAASMLDQWQNSPGVVARVDVAQAMVENGTHLRAEIAYQGGSWVTAFLVDDDGEVTDLSDHLALVDGKVVLNAPVVAIGTGAGNNQLLLAVTSSRELDTLRSPFSGKAADLLPKLLDELNQLGISAAIGMTAFKVYGAGITLK
ncbi:hypothetical protein [Devosia sp. UYZn731]|uniref:hypothetical protein n=1 Tax=Devosia sp. UYZn731 TaxID=3156345 RepID=UPI003391CB0C